MFTNYLLPKQKLVLKSRHGAKVSKKRDRPATPHQRPIITMNAVIKRIKPATLERHVLDLTGRLEILSAVKKSAARRSVEEGRLTL